MVTLAVKQTNLLSRTLMREATGQKPCTKNPNPLTAEPAEKQLEKQGAENRRGPFCRRTCAPTLAIKSLASNAVASE